MREKELYDILHNFNGFHPSQLYTELVVIDGQESSFTEEEQREFIVAYILYQQGALTKENYQKSLLNVDKTKTKLDALIKKIKGILPDWIDLRGQNATPSENNLKLYLSVDNSDLHYFATRLISKSLDKDYNDIDFKINNDQTMNRRDNVVIYCNEKNFGKYISVVEEVLSETPDLKLNAPHLLATPYSEHIYVGIDPNDGKTSYTEQLSNALFQGLRNGKSEEFLVQTILEKQKKNEPEVRALAKLTSQQK